jgi:hypothetical protein
VSAVPSQRSLSDKSSASINDMTLKCGENGNPFQISIQNARKNDFLQKSIESGTTVTFTDYPGCKEGLALVIDSIDSTFR